MLILVLDGLIKPTAPGSLIEPAKTYMFPANWLTLPLSFGLLMSPWYVDRDLVPYPPHIQLPANPSIHRGGHGVFPNVRQPSPNPFPQPLTTPRSTATCGTPTNTPKP